MDKASRDMLKRIYAREPQASILDPEMLYAAEMLVRFKRPSFWLKHPIRDSSPAHWHGPIPSQAASASSVPCLTRSYPSLRRRVLSSKPQNGMYIRHLIAGRSRRSHGGPSDGDTLPWHLAQMHIGARKNSSVEMERRDERGA